MDTTVVRVWRPTCKFDVAAIEWPSDLTGCPFGVVSLQTGRVNRAFHISGNNGRAH
jgi:hypothetical protein